MMPKVPRTKIVPTATQQPVKVRIAAGIHDNVKSFADRHGLRVPYAYAYLITLGLQAATASDEPAHSGGRAERTKGNGKVDTTSSYPAEILRLGPAALFGKLSQTLAPERSRKSTKLPRRPS